MTYSEFSAFGGVYSWNRGSALKVARNDLVQKSQVCVNLARFRAHWAAKNPPGASRQAKHCVLTQICPFLSLVMRHKQPWC